MDFRAFSCETACNPEQARLGSQLQCCVWFKLPTHGARQKMKDVFVKLHTY